MRRLVRSLAVILLAGAYLLVVFLATQLWGTAIYTEQQQASLGAQFSSTKEVVTTTSTTTQTSLPTPSTSAPPATTPDVLKQIQGLDAVGHLLIPSIDLDRYVVAGTSQEALKKGPGHDANTPLPGEAGNVVIVGHRTSYSAPFWDLDRLKVGDEIVLQTLIGDFTYQVSESFEVMPLEYARVVEAQDQPTLTLVTCTPRYTTTRRLVVRAVLVDAADEQRLAPATYGYGTTTTQPVIPGATTIPATETTSPHISFTDPLADDGSAGTQTVWYQDKPHVAQTLFGALGVALVLLIGSLVVKRRWVWVPVGLLAHAPLFFGMLAFVELVS